MASKDNAKSVRNFAILLIVMGVAVWLIQELSFRFLHFPADFGIEFAGASIVLIGLFGTVVARAMRNIERRLEALETDAVGAKGAEAG